MAAAAAAAVLKRTARNVSRSVYSSSPRAFAPSAPRTDLNGLGSSIECLAAPKGNSIAGASPLWRGPRMCPPHVTSMAPSFFRRFVATMGDSLESVSHDAKSLPSEAPPRLKFKRLDKTARHIMQIIDKEAVEQVKTQREIPDIQPGYIVQLKVEVPENKRRVSIVKGIVIARRNAGLNTTFRLRRLVAGVGVESLFPLYSPNLKEIKVLDKKKVRRAKLYYLRDKMNALKKH